MGKPGFSFIEIIVVYVMDNTTKYANIVDEDNTN